MTAEQPAAGHPTSCERCGKAHVRDGKPTCKAHGKRRPDGTNPPCVAWPMKGQRVCKKHGGKTPQSMTAATARQELEKAREAVQVYGLRREVDPRLALLEEVWRTAATVDALEALLAEADADALFGAGVLPAVRTELAAERKHYARVAKDATDAGVSSQYLELAKRSAAATWGAVGEQLLRSVLDRLELTDAQWALAEQVVPDEVRRLKAGAGQ